MKFSIPRLCSLCLCGECCPESLDPSDAEPTEDVEKTEMNTLPSIEEIKHEAKQSFGGRD